MLYCDAATFCRRRNDAGIMTDETERRCAQESIDIITIKKILLSIFIIKIILITYLLHVDISNYRTIHQTANLHKDFDFQKLMLHFFSLHPAIFIPLPQKREESFAVWIKICIFAS